MIYHVMLYRFYHAASNETRLNDTNAYTRHFFGPTLDALRRRRLDLLIELPADIEVKGTAKDTWTDYDLVYNSRDVEGALFSTPALASRRKQVAAHG